MTFGLLQRRGRRRLVGAIALVLLALESAFVLTNQTEGNKETEFTVCLSISLQEKYQGFD